jgi:hypothetical protein
MGNGQTGVAYMQHDEDLEPWYHVIFEIKRDLRDEKDEFDEYLVVIEGKIICDKSTDAEEVYEQIGSLYSILFRIDQIQEDGESVLEVFDSHAAETLQLYECIWDKEHGIFKESLQKKLGEIFMDNILYLENIKINKEHRGKGLALMASKELVKLFGQTCGLIAVRAWPLQYSSRDFNNKLSMIEKQQMKKDFEKLRKYYSKLGFKYFAKDNFLLMQPHMLI